MYFFDILNSLGQHHHTGQSQVYNSVNRLQSLCMGTHWISLGELCVDTYILDQYHTGQTLQNICVGTQRISISHYAEEGLKKLYGLRKVRYQHNRSMETHTGST